MDLKQAADAAVDREGARFTSPNGLSWRTTAGWIEVHRYEKMHEDGHEAIVSVQALPAKFYRIHCLELDIDLTTGSGMEELADSIATAIAGGMLGNNA